MKKLTNIIIPSILSFSFIVAPANSEDIYAQIKNKIEKNVEKKNNEESEYDKLNRLEDQLIKIFSPIPYRVYSDLKKNGIEFDNSIELATKIKKSIKKSIEINEIKSIQGSEFISFYSYTFMRPNRWKSFSFKGSSVLYSVDAGMDWDAKPCKFYVETRGFYPGAGFERGGWSKDQKSFDCSKILSGKADKEIKSYLKKMALKSIK